MYREEQLKALLAGRSILIAGYGREGRSTEALVRRLLPDAPVAIADGNTRIASEAAKGCYDLVVKSPGVPMRVLPEACRPRVTSLTDLFLQVYGDLTIGVTGTKGKSTTASLIHHLLQGSLLAGNIGVPLFDIVDELHEGVTVVAELSCHQLEGIRRAPHIAVLLNLFQEHLDHYDNYDGYKMAKMQIALRQRTGDHFFYSTDNEELVLMVHRERDRMAGMQDPYSINDVAPEERDLLEALPLEGEHNRSNALVALRVCRLVAGSGAGSTGAFRSRLAAFQGLRHRMERVGERRGIVWYDDSISTIPAATIAAVKALGRVDTLILGGFDRGIDYSPLVDFLKEAHTMNLVFVGQAGRRICTALGRKDRVLVEDDYASIVAWCAGHTPQGGVVLLSPAAASYDSFKNFEQRGDCFRQQIMNL